MIRSYPAALSNAVAVAAVGVDGNASSVQKANFSNYGPWVDIAAPGVNLISTISGSSVGPESGTSMASPVVAGAAGLLLSAFPSLTYGELRDRLLNTASASRLYGSELDSDGGAVNLQYYYPKVSGESVRRPLLGGGLLDVNGMLNNSKNSATGQPIERVTAGCGVIGADVSTAAQLNGQAVLIFLIFVPLLVVLFRRKVM
jgi:subtilisin family serine protease